MPANLQTVDRYAGMFARLKAEDRHALIPFMVLGWPNPQTCLETIDALVAGGATALELGLAFSDPVADGPIIQQAAKEVLDQGFTVNDALKLLKTIRQRHPEIPIGLLVYYNLILARGTDQFFADVAEAGLDGVLIADLPPELVDEVLSAANANHLQLIAMVSTLTGERRLQEMLRYAGGFLYVVSRLGITGVEERYDESLSELIQVIRSRTNLPLCVGFGISKPEHVKSMLSLGADGVIVGSTLINHINALSSADELTTAVSSYMQTLAKP